MKIIKTLCTKINIAPDTLEIFRQLLWRLFTSTCNMPFLLNSGSILFFPFLVILSSISLPLNIENRASTKLNLDYILNRIIHVEHENY